MASVLTFSMALDAPISARDAIAIPCEPLRENSTDEPVRPASPVSSTALRPSVPHR